MMYKVTLLDGSTKYANEKDATEASNSGILKFVEEVSDEDYNKLVQSRGKVATDEMNKSISEGRKQSFKEEHPWLSNYASAIAPESYEETMKTGNTNPTLTNVKEAAPAIIAGLATGGVSSILPASTTLASYLVPTAAALAGKEAYDITKYATSNVPDKSYLGFTEQESLPAIALETAMGPIGQGGSALASKLFTKAFNVAAKGNIDKVLLANKEKIVANIQNAIDSKIKSSPEVAITPDDILNSVTKVIDDLRATKTITAAEASKISDKVLENIDATDILNLKEVQSRLVGLKGSMKYEDPMKYVGLPERARTITAQGIEASIPTASKDIIELQKAARGVKSGTTVEGPWSLGQYGLETASPLLYKGGKSLKYTPTLGLQDYLGDK